MQEGIFTATEYREPALEPGMPYQGPIETLLGTFANEPDAIEAARTLMGPTNPVAAPPGTIRGDFGLITTENLVHGSDSPESAIRELEIWFG